MSVLSQKLQQATKLFQGHNFKRSLQAYEDCLNFCHKTDESQSIIFNILSTKATLQYILGDYDEALSTLNSVLRKDPNHFLSLLRRSQVYKKKNKLKKALKDLQTIFVFCPDNLQISAFKVQIQHLLLKNEKQHQITSQSDDAQEPDEESQLNFIKLKLIDRKSSDGSAVKQRKSRVTILGDTTFEYKIEQDLNDLKDEQDFKDKAIRTYKQIQLDDDEQQCPVPIISVKAPRRGKSILKNKGVSIFIHDDDAETRRSRYLGRQSKLLTLVKNIDGKVIPSAEHEHQSHPEVKQVEFRKSISQLNELLPVPNDNHSVASSRQRKSCLKRPSFQVPVPKNKNDTIRKSRFQSIDSSKIDGHFITHKRKSIDKSSSAQLNSQGQVDEVKQHSDSESEGSEHNIFGSKRFVMSQDIKQKLGFTDDNHEMSLSQNFQQPKLKGKKSILKKNSSVLMTSPNPKKTFGQNEDLTKSNMSLRSKKSVMFSCTL